MDVYHKILVKIYELTGGKDSVDVDMSDLLKREGFFPSIDSITQHLLDESWVTEAKHKQVVRMTHWGAAEAKRVVADLPDRKQMVAKDAAKLLSESKEFIIMLEEFAAAPDGAKLDTIEKRHADLSPIIKRIAQNI
jgi:hypothetical protein